MVNQLAADPEFLDLYQQVVSAADIEPLLVQLADPADNSVDSAPPGTPGSALVTARADLRDHPLRLKLQPYLEKRLWNRTGEFPESASWFVCDRFGNQIASAFREPNQTLGKNYAYRTYFTGLDSDLPTSQFSLSRFRSPTQPETDSDRFEEFLTDDPFDQQLQLIQHLSQRQIIDRPHLSAAFRSDQSNSWKVAFSRPIVIDDEIAGIVAVTVDLGGFVDFVNRENHYVMLIDDRPGENRGIILEHPLHQKLVADKGSLPEELGRLIVDLQAAQASKLFVDPVGSTEIGRDFDRPSIVGISPVMLRTESAANGLNNFPSQNDEPEDHRHDDGQATGLVVMALEDYAVVVAPVDGLVAQWRVLALLASGGLLLISLMMWLFVRRLLQESRERLERAFSPASTEILSVQQRETLLSRSRPTAAPTDTT